MIATRSMIATSAARVAQNTEQYVNEKIRRKTEQNVVRCAAEGRESINRRLHELDHEWDIERVLETMAPSVTLIGLCLGITRSRKWLAIPALVNSFFLQHAIQGWCPPLPFLRRMGFRTSEEIDRERFALKALRGDFNNISPSPLGDKLAAQSAVAAVDR